MTEAQRAAQRLSGEHCIHCAVPHQTMSSRRSGRRLTMSSWAGSRICPGLLDALGRNAGAIVLERLERERAAAR
jgi:hypothetical protein